MESRSTSPDPAQRVHRTRSEREPIMHRTAPEAAPLVVGRAVQHDTPRRRIAWAVTMLVVGGVAVLGGMIALGTRVGPTAVAVRDTELDPVATFFFGTSGSVGELLLVIGLLLAVVIGLVLGAIGYRRLTDDGPALASMHIGNSPSAIIGRNSTLGS